MTVGLSNISNTTKPNELINTSINTAVGLRNITVIKTANNIADIPKVEENATNKVALIF